MKSELDDDATTQSGFFDIERRAALNAEVLADVEAEDRIALQRSNDSYLVPRGVGFTYNMLIDGNDERGIDVGVYSKHPIRSIHSNISLGLPGERTFSRDCSQF